MSAAQQQQQQQQQAIPSLGHVLITGGCGFLGHHIVNLLLDRHPATTVSVLDLRTNLNRHPSPSVSYHDGDITDLAAMQTLFARLRPDAVIHTASPHFNAPAPVLHAVNVDGTRNLLTAAREAGVKAFVYTSSASVVFDSTTGLVHVDERWPVVAGKDQPEYYTSTKAWAEMAVLEANAPTGTPTPFLTAAIRPAGIFGENDVQMFPKFLTAYRKGQHRFQLGDNTNLFDFTYVGNVAHGHLLALAALLRAHSQLTTSNPTTSLDDPTTTRVHGEAFFITNDQPVYFWDFTRAAWVAFGATDLHLQHIWHLSEGTAFAIGAVLEALFRLRGRTPNLTRQQARYSCMTRYFCIDKAKRRLGYRPIVELEEGVRRAAASALENERRAGEKKTQ